MARGKVKHDWNIAAELWCATINVHIGKDGDPVQPWHIHPLRNRSDYHQDQSSEAATDILRAMANGKRTKH